MYDAALYSEIYDNPFIRVVVGVENERLQGCFAVANGCRNVANDIFHYVSDVKPRFCRNSCRVFGRDADNVLDILYNPLGLGARQVNLVNYGDNFEVVVDGEIGVCQRLRLDSL